MTDRLKGFVVVFDKDIREDDAEQLQQAILCMKNVVEVKPVKADFEDEMIRLRVRREIVGEIWKLLFPDSKRNRVTGEESK